jgi:hypothetical protein
LIPERALSILSETFDDDLLFAGAVLSLIAVEMLAAGQSMLIASGQRRRR